MFISGKLLLKILMLIVSILRRYAVLFCVAECLLSTPSVISVLKAWIIPKFILNYGCDFVHYGAPLTKSTIYGVIFIVRWRKIQ